MSRAALSALVALVALGAAPADGPANWLDALRWNARERTAAGLADLEAGRAAKGAEELDAALRLHPDDPLVVFNAGTGRLAAGRPDAVGPLEQAARSASDRLAPDAWYNLGAARLAAGDPAGAATAFTETLRRDPGRADAKRNLELALRALEQERQNRRSGADPNRETPPEPSAPGSQGGEDARPTEPDEPPDAPEGDDARQQRADPGRDGADPAAAPDAAQGEPGESGPPPATDGSPRRPTDGGPLPRFRDLPEMTAEQAAALLQAVENLERDERRRRARERALAAGEQDLDW